ncbi:hypothetical protein BZL41_00950 [Pseudomonas sp. PIC25]|nr:hypothetical protein BZL41_00950 [Pseudomonas sp. PIC25]
MRKALGLATTPEPTKPRIKSPIPIRYTLVTLSVRKPAGGLPFRYEYQSRSMSSLEAQLEAEKAVREERLEVWAVLDIKQIER